MARDTSVVDATFVHADTNPGVAGSTTGVGSPWTDFEGSHWKINGNRIYGVSFVNDGVKACCYYDSGNILEGAVKLDYDSFNMGCLMRFSSASGGSGYAFAINGGASDANGAFYVYKCVNGTQTSIASGQDWGGGFIDPGSDQIEMQVRDISATSVLIAVMIRSKLTPTVTYGLRHYYDTSSPITATGRAGVATYYNGSYGGGGATRVQTLSQTIVASSEERFGFLFIGDSITGGIGVAGGSCLDSAGCVNINVIKVYDQGDTFLTFQNSAIAGTKTADWVNNTSGANIETACAAAVAKGINVAHVMLGTNDAQVSFLAAATYKTNMQLIVNRILAAGIPKVILNQLIYNNNPAHTAGEHTTCIGLLQAYSTKMDEIADATPGVYRGDRTVYAITAGDWVTYDSGDGIHPNQAGHTLIGSAWATAWKIIRRGATVTQHAGKLGDTITGTFLSGSVVTPTAAYLTVGGTPSTGYALTSFSVDSAAGTWTGVVPAGTPSGLYRVTLTLAGPTMISTNVIPVSVSSATQTALLNLI